MRSIYRERDIRLKFLQLPFSERVAIGEKMIPNSFSDIGISENKRSIDFLLEVKKNDGYDELWDLMSHY